MSDQADNTGDATGVAYVPQTPWSPLSALGMTVVVMIASFMIAGFAGGVILTIVGALRGTPIDPTAPESRESLMQMLLPAMFISQIAMTTLTWVLAGQMRGDPERVLALRPSRQTTLDTILVVVLFVVVSYALAALIYSASGSTGSQDTRQLMPLVNTNLWPFSLIVITLGAAISEEFLFRGFLFSALARSRFGTRGAAVVSSALWAVIHYYSWQGMLTLFCMGLLLSFILVRSGSLWTVVLCHAVFNLCSFIALMTIAQSGVAV